MFDPSAIAISAYLALKYYAFTTSGACEGISIRTLAGRVKVSESTMKRGIAELVSKRVVKVIHRSKSSHSGERIPLPNLYEIVDIKPAEDGEI